MHGAQLASTRLCQHLFSGSLMASATPIRTAGAAWTCNAGTTVYTSVGSATPARARLVDHANRQASSPPSLLKVRESGVGNLSPY